MSKRITLSGLEHMVRLLNSRPELMSLASLAPLQHVAEIAKDKGQKCGCNVGQVYRENIGTFEVALGNIQHGDHLVMKRLLGVDTICYYVTRDGSKPQLKCI